MANGWDSLLQGAPGGSSLYDSFASGFKSTQPTPPPADESPTEIRGWDALMGAAMPRQDTPALSKGAPDYEGGKVDPEYVIQGLMQRGLPRYVAEGFAMNFGDESGFDPGINERNPIVEGSRGGFGLYQLTGPRRRAYESYAQQNGLALGDPDAQMDFLMRELNSTESAARKAILSTSNAGEAGAAIVNKFLRPAEQHRRHRAQKYISNGSQFARGGEVAQPTRDAQPRLWNSMGGA